MQATSVAEGIARGWMLVSGAMLLAVLAIGALLLYARVQAITEPPTITLPASPTRVAPRMEQVSLPDPALLERLQQSVRPKPATTSTPDTTTPADPQ